MYALMLILLASCSEQNEEAPALPDEQAQHEIQSETYDGGFFIIEIPAGWKVITTGGVGNLAIWMTDPDEPSRQVFIFSAIGPYYLSDIQKEIDARAAAMGGPVQRWSELPVVEPHTFINFFLKWNQFTEIWNARTRDVKYRLPRFDNLEIIEVQPAQSQTGGKAELVHALFTQNGKVIEGLFKGEVIQVAPFTGFPSGHTGMVKSFTGITAPKEDFERCQAILTRSIATLRYRQDYVQQANEQLKAAGSRAIQTGETLRESSDILSNAWNQRQNTYDVIAGKRSDAILSKERYYDPGSGQVYEFPLGWYDKYDINRSKYNKKDLQPIPDDDHEMWEKPALDGSQFIFAE